MGRTSADYLHDMRAAGAVLGEFWLCISFERSSVFDRRRLAAAKEARLEHQTTRKLHLCDQLSPLRRGLVVAGLLGIRMDGALAWRRADVRRFGGEPCCMP